ncbi:MAG: pyruvate-ferredoxin/flavodoxin oxidoreductase [Verrucomicrobiales bacterium]|jgi:pyruvate-ferredoxin/flavodoxin oxidoreductase
MSLRKLSTSSNRLAMDGNEAAAHVAYRLSEVIGIYPITPASPMGELSDAWSVRGRENLFGAVPKVIEMQSEGGAAGALHGALQAGSLCTTFTASQGLLLMLPNLYKIAGELTSTVFHIAARSVAAQALSIFGDHSDVMATRATGWGMLFANSVQEVMDMALIAHAVTLQSRVPFLHVFDGFRTSHEISDIEVLGDDVLSAMIDHGSIRAHRERALSPDDPFIRGTAQNPDAFFQAREAVNPFYLATPTIVQESMERLEALVGRSYHLFDYYGAPDAERVIVSMGSGCGAIDDTVRDLLAQGEKVGVLKVRLFRPFSVEHFIEALPQSVRRIAVLDRTKEPGSAGEPLYQDVLTAVVESGFDARVVGGRYGLSSKEFHPGMVKAVFDGLASESPKNHFTIGIRDDVTQTSLEFELDYDIEPDSVTRAVFWGLGSDGTVGANKNSIKIISRETSNHVQGYFVYDSKKAGARTISHLRFGPQPIESTYLIRSANFVGVHQFSFLDRYDPLQLAADGATVLMNCHHDAESVWGHLPGRAQRQILEKGLRLYVIDAYKLASKHHLAMRINTIMQVCFFSLCDVMETSAAVEAIKGAISDSYGKRGSAIVDNNISAVDAALDHLYEVKLAGRSAGGREVATLIPASAPEFVRDVTGALIRGDGDLLPVSAFPPDGTYPSSTTRWEKRNIARAIPEWEPDICIQCGKCVLVCPHAVIRAKVCEPSELATAPEGFKISSARWKERPDELFTIQVAPEDCTGCQLCVEVCPAKDKSRSGHKALNMVPKNRILDEQKRNWDFFQSLPNVDRNNGLELDRIKDVQLLPPLFEFSGACAGCGETPYLKLMSQLYGDRAMIANATGCSSIYGGNLPTTPWCTDDHGRGPSWSNSLFEDNAEFGLGMRLAVDAQRDYAVRLLSDMAIEVGEELASEILSAEQRTDGDIAKQRERVSALKEKLRGLDESDRARDLLVVADTLVRRSVWIVGGDGWAYDIGYGGLDHVLAGSHDVNVLVLDTEVYSNTGGQASKATSLGAVAKFASGGKATPKKDLGRLAMSYGHIYVAQVAMGSSDVQTLKAFREAEAHPGPSLIIAYSQCIAHGIDMSKGMGQQKLAVDSGHWLLYRYNPALAAEGRNPLQIDSKRPKIPLEDYLYTENRYSQLQRADPETAKALLEKARAENARRRSQYEALAAEPPPQRS